MNRLGEDNGNIDAPLVESDVEALFNLFFQRNVNNDEFKRDLVSRGMTLRQLIKQLRGSEELKIKLATEIGTKYSKDMLDDYRFRVPKDLSVNSVDLKKIFFIGSCLMEPWADVIRRYDNEVIIESITFNNASSLPSIDSSEASEINFQILQIPIRSVLPEADYFSIKYSDIGAYEDVFNAACVRLKRNLEAILEYNTRHGILSFVLNFAVPQHNPMGRMHGRYSLSNTSYFVEELNKKIYEFVSARRNVFVLDFDQIINVYGKKYFQDDSVSHINHGSFLGSIAMKGDENRLEPVGSVEALYTPHVEKYILATYEEVVASYRTLQQEDSIKLVVFDLDDTLWRGVAGDTDIIGPHMTEGWPLGVLEAASYLWKRGILIAIVSKNDEDNVLRIWQQLYSKVFSIDNFVVKKINWEKKSENIRDILAMVNLLPQNVLFVDDNPVERAIVKAAFPEIRVMNAPVACWRRILLWSAETQQAMITRESIARTNMIQAQIRREIDKEEMSRGEFLSSLALSIRSMKISDQNDHDYNRCFELINKTNQFNTTGKRWSSSEMENLFTRGGYLIAIDAKDKYTDYGIVGVMLIVANVIEQFVLSCRVFGMDVEHACVALAKKDIENDGFDIMRARIEKTDKNKLCLGLYESNGFEDLKDGYWEKDISEVAELPEHIHLEGRV